MHRTIPKWGSYVKCYFLKTPGDDDVNTIYASSTSSDSLIPGCLLKTVDALRVLFERDEPFDYLVRTNLSSLWDLYGLQRKYRSRLGHQPEPVSVLSVGGRYGHVQKVVETCVRAFLRY